MKKREAIKDRCSNKPTLYYPSEKMTEIPDIGNFPSLLQRMCDDEDGVQSNFKLAAVTTDFIYYADEEESDDTASIVMLTRGLKLVSDNFLGSNDLAKLVENNEGLLWISNAVKYWQREQFVKPELITAEVKNILEDVDVEKLTDKEKVIYFAYLNNGPVNYTKPESLMAVMSIDIDNVNFSDQLAAIKEIVKKNEDQLKLRH